MVAQICARIAVMRLWEIATTGAARDIFAAPDNRIYARAFGRLYRTPLAHEGCEKPVQKPHVGANGAIAAYLRDLLIMFRTVT